MLKRTTSAQLAQDPLLVAVLSNHKKITMNKHIELAKKLKALAERGVGGEKVNAEKMLNDLLKKHNLTIEDIDGEEISNHFFKIKKEDVNLLHQIILTVNYELKLFGEIPAKDVRRFQMDGNWFTKCTASEFVEIKAMFDFFSKAYKKELEIFFTAFIKANQLFPKKTKEENKQEPEWTKDDILKWEKVNQMSKGITKSNYIKQLDFVK